MLFALMFIATVSVLDASLTFHHQCLAHEELYGMAYTFRVIIFLTVSEQFAGIRLASLPSFASSYVRVYVQLP